ncbi:NAD-dependent epimerase/dehydratase family protein [Pseudolysobacter antarcticus]|uniref:NAD-dependent epimerase/dehydratase family protein n=2 Tax=Pseudolysobacter antarcticus TaxID=2511995 RepID=A0A411HFC1_9GAMM|nr:NAD-dependent epimerase/dehydratase family protein [Pseudolysobacter antarcticus]
MTNIVSFANNQRGIVMARVLLTGASGFLGSHLLQQLLAQNVEVLALARSESSAAALRALGAEPVRGDVRDADSLKAAMATPLDAVFHVAADTSTWRGDAAQQTLTNVGGTNNVIAAVRAAKVARLIHTSSVSAFGMTEETLTENLPRRGADSWINYERNKAATEAAVRAAVDRGEIDAVILNPAHILGPGDRHNWAQMFIMIDQGKLPGAPPGAGAFADVREVATAHIAAWRGGRSGESYLLGGDHASFLTLVQGIASQLDRPSPKRALPATVLRAYAQVLNFYSRFSGHAPSLTPEAVAFTCHHLRVDSSKAERELGYRSTALNVLIADTCAWLREQGLISGNAAKT